MHLNYKDEYLSQFHEDYLRRYVEFELERQERCSNSFLSRPVQIVRGRPASRAETQAMLDSLDPGDEESLGDI